MSAVEASGETGSPESGGRQRAVSRRLVWWRRPTVTALVRQEKEGWVSHRGKWDDRDNGETLPPDGERVQIGGVVLTELFTPSTVSVLYDLVENWPRGSTRNRDEWLADLDRCRSGESGGWRNLGVVRPAGDMLFGEGFTDANLPHGVRAVWLNLSYPLPSVAALVATFTFDDSVADLTGLLRANYQSRVEEVHISIPGMLGELRARIPWSRPAHHSARATLVDVRHAKRRAVTEYTGSLRRDCMEWFTTKFPGRFAAAPDSERPTLELLLTDQTIPWTRRESWLDALGLNTGLGIWRGGGRDGWAVATGSWPHERRRFLTTVAARRSDVAQSPGGGESGDDNWYLTQRFSMEQHALAVGFALVALLSLYANGLARLRDRAGAPRLRRRWVGEARAFDGYLIGDGLDSASIAADLMAPDDRGIVLNMDFPRYLRERLGAVGADKEQREESVHLGASIAALLRQRATRLAGDTTRTVEIVRGSAELRQAVANTGLQRAVGALSVLAVIIAVIGIMASG